MERSKRILETNALLAAGRKVQSLNTSINMSEFSHALNQMTGELLFLDTKGHSAGRNEPQD